MVHMENTGLVLEGGGMRGVFTAGVLDYMMDNGITFPYTIAVSAGACNAVSYIAGQRGRSKKCDVELLKKYKYIGMRSVLRKRSIMDMDLLFKDFPSTIIPVDFEAFFKNSNRCVFVVTNCETGKPEYFEEKSDAQRLNDICRASSSLPFLCPITYIEGVPMLDGGICDAIPLKRAMAEGYAKNVVVLTRNRGYRKKGRIKVPYFFYRKYPKLKEQLRKKNAEYNEMMNYIESHERTGELLVIRPKRKIEVDRLERNMKKLNNLYEHGYECARLVFEGVK
ncbi:MAG: patatin family protein [Paludibacteraceae bacterium]|nr:patatin family protein [Paludibacteraceae bacterium]